MSQPYASNYPFTSEGCREKEKKLARPEACGEALPVIWGLKEKSNFLRRLFFFWFNIHSFIICMLLCVHELGQRPICKTQVPPLPRGVRGLNLGYQTWQQTSLLAEPFSWLQADQFCS